MRHQTVLTVINPAFVGFESISSASIKPCPPDLKLTAAVHRRSSHSRAYPRIITLIHATPPSTKPNLPSQTQCASAQTVTFTPPPPPNLPFHMKHAPHPPHPGAIPDRSPRLKQSPRTEQPFVCPLFRSLFIHFCIKKHK